MRRTAAPKHIRPSSIKLGDTIQVRWVHKDVTRITVGIVGKRDVGGFTGTVYETVQGQHLVTEFKDGHRSPAGCIITLVQEAPEPDIPLEGLENV